MERERHVRVLVRLPMHSRRCGWEIPSLGLGSVLGLRRAFRHLGSVGGGPRWYSRLPLQTEVQSKYYTNIPPPRRMSPMSFLFAFPRFITYYHRPSQILPWAFFPPNGAANEQAKETHAGFERDRRRPSCVRRLIDSSSFTPLLFNPVSLQGIPEINHRPRPV